MKERVKKILLISLGIVAMTLGAHLFLVPNSMATGGVTGIAILANAVFPNIPVSLFLFVGNLILFILGWFTLGNQFGIYTLYGSLLYSGLLAVLEKLFPIEGPLVNNILVNLIFGTGLTGIGLAIVFTQNASTGGTDILSLLLNKYFHIELGRSILIIDAAIVMGSAFILSLEHALYALLGVIITSKTLDNFIAGLDRRIVMSIATSKPQEVNDFIHMECDRGATIYPTEGGFTGKKQPIIVTVVHRNEYLQIKNFISEIDPYAFVYMYYVSEVYGEGFTYHAETAKNLKPRKVFRAYEDKEERRLQDGTR